MYNAVTRDVNVSFFVNETFGFSSRKKQILIFFLGSADTVLQLCIKKFG
jgi:hypothetical protein